MSEGEPIFDVVDDRFAAWIDGEVYPAEIDDGYNVVETTIIFDEAGEVEKVIFPAEIS